MEADAIFRGIRHDVVDDVTAFSLWDYVVVVISEPHWDKFNYLLSVLSLQTTKHSYVNR